MSIGDIIEMEKADLDHKLIMEDITNVRDLESQVAKKNLQIKELENFYNDEVNKHEALKKQVAKLEEELKNTKEIILALREERING